MSIKHGFARLHFLVSYFGGAMISVSSYEFTNAIISEVRQAVVRGPSLTGLG